MRAVDLGMTGNESPDQIDANKDLGELLEHIRARAGVLMGFAPDPETLSSQSKAVPKIAMVSSPQDIPLLDGNILPAADFDFGIRMISMGICHKAVPLTGGMCASVAAAVAGGVVNDMLDADVNLADRIRLGTPSGMIPFGATVSNIDGNFVCEKVTVYRTARRLMDGKVYVPDE